MDLSALRKMRNNRSSLKEIQEVITKQNAPSGSKKGKDDRFWSAERDDAGNGSAVIRFLPKHPDDKLPWVRLFTHSFQGPTGKWYIENSLSTLEQKDPVGDLNQQLWNSGIEANKNTVRKQKRKLSYICNILVIKDSRHPENEGQVKLFKFGKKIYDMIADKINPTFEDEEPVDVFDLWEGANFKLRIRDVEGYANYDKSEFAAPSELLDGDEEEVLKVMNQLHHLGEFIAPDKFKSYDQLQKRLDEVLNGTAPTSSAEEDALETTKTAPEPKTKIKEAPAKKVAAKVADDEDDDSSFFSSSKKETSDDDSMKKFKQLVDDENPF